MMMATLISKAILKTNHTKYKDTWISGYTKLTFLLSCSQMRLLLQFLCCRREGGKKLVSGWLFAESWHLSANIQQCGSLLQVLPSPSPPPPSPPPPPCKCFEQIRLIFNFQGNIIDLPKDEDTPEKRVDKIFRQMDKVSECKYTNEYWNLQFVRCLWFL